MSSGISPFSDDTVVDVQAQYIPTASPNQVPGQLDSFIAEVSAILDPTNEDHRTVLNLVPFLQGIRNRIRPIGAFGDDYPERTGNHHADLVATYLNKFMLAAERAEAAGRITSAQLSAIETAYTNNW